MDKCFYCETELILEGNDDCSNFDYEEDDEAIISYLHCPKCGRSYEIMEPSREEKENEYKDYWQNSENNENN